MKEIVNQRETEENKAKNDIINVDHGNKDEIKSDVEYDILLSSAGELGRYQVMLFFSTFPFYVFGVFVYYSQLFMTEVSPNHWCWIPELENLTAIERRTLAIPEADTRFGYSQCLSYDANWTQVLLTGQKPNSSWNLIPCQYGWEFNGTEIPYPTIASEMGWVCERKSYPATAQAFFFLGSAVGGISIGWIADRFGRLPAVVLSNVIGCIGGSVSIFARNIIEFTISRFFLGIAYDNCMMMAYLIMVEYVAPKYRTLVANMSFAIFYALASTTLPWIALACQHWKTLALATSLPLSLAILSPLVIPESPRWLLSKGRIDETVEKVLTIGRINRKEVPSKLIKEFKLSVSAKKEAESSNCLKLLKRPLLRRMFICICLEYICCTIVFDALLRILGQLDYDIFVSFSLLSFTEFPSQVIVAFIMDWIGRRWLTAVVMTVSCIFCVITAFLGGGLPSVMCVFVARFAVNMAYAAITLWAAEMLPTSVRGSGASVIHITGYIATIVSPYLKFLETYARWLPLVVVGFVAGVAAAVALALPETGRKDMPQTFDDAEELVKSQKFWDLPCKKSKNIRENSR